METLLKHLGKGEGGGSAHHPPVLAPLFLDLSVGGRGAPEANQPGELLPQVERERVEQKTCTCLSFTNSID